MSRWLASNAGVLTVVGDGEDRRGLEMSGLFVSASVVGRMVRTVVEQRFDNGWFPGERGEYSILLPQSASLVAFQVRDDEGQTIRATLMERKPSPASVESRLFVTPIKFGSGESTTIKLAYEQLLPRHPNGYVTYEYKLPFFEEEKAGTNVNFWNFHLWTHQSVVVEQSRYNTRVNGTNADFSAVSERPQGPMSFILRQPIVPVDINYTHRKGERYFAADVRAPKSLNGSEPIRDIRVRVLQGEVDGLVHETPEALKSGEVFLVMGKMRSDAVLEITGTSGDKPWKQTVMLKQDAPGKWAESFLPTFWANFYLQQNKDTLSRKDMIKLSREHGVVSPHTSWALPGNSAP